MLPGDNIILTIKASGTLTNILWTIPPTAFSKFDPTNNTTQLTSLGPENPTNPLLNQQTVNFYWSSTGAQTVSVTFSIDGVPHGPISADFFVSSVPVNFATNFETPKIGNFAFNAEINPNEFYLIGPNGGEGIQAYATVNTPEGFADGFWTFTQIFLSEDYYSQSFTKPYICKEKAGTNWLDKDFYYNTAPYSTNSLQGQQSFADSPGFTPVADYSQVKLINSLKVFIMFKPSDNDTPVNGPANWVPIYSFTYQYKGCGELVSVGGGLTQKASVKWSVTNNPPPSAWQQETVHPHWTAINSSQPTNDVPCTGPCGNPPPS